MWGYEQLLVAGRQSIRDGQMSDEPERWMGRLQMRAEMVRAPRSPTLSRRVAGSGKIQRVIRAENSNLPVPEPFIFNRLTSHNKTTKNKLLFISFLDDKTVAWNKDTTCQGYTAGVTQRGQNWSLLPPTGIHCLCIVGRATRVHRTPVWRLGHQWRAGIQGEFTFRCPDHRKTFKRWLAFLEKVCSSIINTDDLQSRMRCSHMHHQIWSLKQLYEVTIGLLEEKWSNPDRERTQRVHKPFPRTVITWTWKYCVPHSSLPVTFS